MKNYVSPTVCNTKEDSFEIFISSTIETKGVHYIAKNESMKKQYIPPSINSIGESEAVQLKFTSLISF